MLPTVRKGLKGGFGLPEKREQPGRSQLSPYVGRIHRRGGPG